MTTLESNKIEIFKNEIKRLQKELELTQIELLVHKLEPFWKKECIEVAKKYGWSVEKGFSDRDKANAFRNDMKGRDPYIKIRALRAKYVMIKYGKLVDEDTLEEIEDPHNMIIHHMTSGTFNPRGFCIWENIKIKHRKNDRCNFF